ncbi:MAG: serine/threonine-protein kinase, partial [Bdellovibrionia bacterium]
MSPSGEDSSKLPPGYQVGEYRVSGFLRAEDFGDVYAAEHVVLGRAAEVKFIWDASHQYYLAALPSVLLKGAKLLAGLNHPNVAAIESAGEIDGRTYVIRRAIAGTHLGEYVDRRTPSLEEGLRILDSVAAALSYCHENGVIHQNLKPGTIFLNERNEPVLTDFTIAVQEGTCDNQEIRYIGTPGYMSPEQWRKDPVTRATDIWGFGAMAYFVFSAKTLPPSVEDTSSDWSRAAA